MNINSDQHFVLLGLGSNIEPELNIEFGINALRKLDLNIQFSQSVKSKSVGFNGDDFINNIVIIHSSLNLLELKTQMKKIEKDIGIVSNPSGCFNKKLDIDIITYQNWTGTYFNLTLPRPEVFYNAHVLGPLAKFKPDYILPSQTKTAQDLWNKYKHKSRIEFI
ncbi:MAG: 2-amino-4-hydroxy-6-hydroxymethyldihydropteridine diphosphokinase [Saccharospirillaceae bacterium]|nr:2-amino-4-hydroxy-6-hydroxymethyldihydropteridine diphosphokinase [Pseudomonadales bacterium]NRB81506.1 2-amino-4-hydroxy-6-hydroxymethyldihydropteridine diphosphokinase [Saccharospirillaceae bacterium]